MKVLNAVHAQGVGGVNQVFQDYTKTLKDCGFEVACLISDNGFDNYKCDKLYKLKNRSQFFDLLRLYFIILRFNPDVVICHSARVMSWLKILKPFTKCKSVAVNHGISFKKSLRCDYIININDEINELVVNSGFDKTKSFIINNAIEINQEYRAKKIEKKLKLGIYGRYEKRKGFDIFFKAASLLKDCDFDLEFKIGGFATQESWSLEDLKGFAKDAGVYDDCEFYGLVQDKKDFFSDVDIFVVPSIEEPFGIVILEGFLHSTLVVSSDTDGGKLIIRNGENGFLFKNQNAEDLAIKVKAAIENKDNYVNYTKRAYDDLEEKFSCEVLSKNLSEILYKILKN